MPRKYFEIPFQWYKNARCHRSRDMSPDRNWVKQIWSNFADPYLGDELIPPKKKLPIIFFYVPKQLCQILSKSESVMSGTLDDLTWNDSCVLKACPYMYVLTVMPVRVKERTRVQIGAVDCTLFESMAEAPRHFPPVHEIHPHRTPTQSINQSI